MESHRRNTHNRVVHTYDDLDAPDRQMQKDDAWRRDKQHWNQRQQRQQQRQQRRQQEQGQHRQQQHEQHRQQQHEQHRQQQHEQHRQQQHEQHRQQQHEQHRQQQHDQHRQQQHDHQDWLQQHEQYQQQEQGQHHKRQMNDPRSADIKRRRVNVGRCQAGNTPTTPPTNNSTPPNEFDEPLERVMRKEVTHRDLLRRDMRRAYTEMHAADAVCPCFSRTFRERLSDAAYRLIVRGDELHSVINHMPTNMTMLFSRMTDAERLMTIATKGTICTMCNRLPSPYRRGKLDHRQTQEVTLLANAPVLQTVGNFLGIFGVTLVELWKLASDKNFRVHSFAITKEATCNNDSTMALHSDTQELLLYRVKQMAVYNQTKGSWRIGKPSPGLPATYPMALQALLHLLSAPKDIVEETFKDHPHLLEALFDKADTAYDNKTDSNVKHTLEKKFASAMGGKRYFKLRPERVIVPKKTSTTTDAPKSTTTTAADEALLEEAVAMAE